MHWPLKTRKYLKAHGLVEDTALGFKAVPSAWMTFKVSSSDVQTSSAIPDADVSLRLEHILGDGGGQRLFLHNSEARKPERADKANVGHGGHSDHIVGVKMTSVHQLS